MVGALLLYMAFLMLVDPLIRKPDAYTERLHNEEENEVVMPQAPLCEPPGPSVESVTQAWEGSPSCSSVLHPTPTQQGLPLALS